MTNSAVQTSELTSDPSLKASIRDGAGCAWMLGAGESYLGVFGIFMRATSVQIGILATLPLLFAAISQAVSVWFMEKVSSRRAICTWANILQALVWLPIALIPILIGTGYQAVNVLILFAMVYYSFGGFGAPVWNSLIGDLVPADTRGRFFGYRNRLCGMSTFTGLMLAGQMLEACKYFGHPALGFAIIFGTALAARLYSAYWLQRHRDPEYVSSREHFFSFWQFIRRTPNSNFARFVFFVSTVNFSVFIAGPYFAVYMLRDLHLSYVEFTMLNSVQMVAQFMTMQHWGELTDRFGNKKILNVCAYGITIAPVLWLFTSSFWGIVIIQTYSGFVWAGFNLAAANFMFDAVTPPKRARCVAYQAIINGTFVLCGSLLGGYIAGHLPAPTFLTSHLPVAASPYLTLFFISGVGRLATALFFLPKFKEVREVDPIRSKDLIFRMVHLRTSGATFGLIAGLQKVRDASKGLKAVRLIRKQRNPLPAVPETERPRPPREDRPNIH